MTGLLRIHAHVLSVRSREFCYLSCCACRGRVWPLKKSSTWSCAKCGLHHGENVVHYRYRLLFEVCDDYGNIADVVAFGKTVERIFGCTADSLVRKIKEMEHNIGQGQSPTALLFAAIERKFVASSVMLVFHVPFCTNGKAVHQPSLAFLKASSQAGMKKLNGWNCDSLVAQDVQLLHSRTALHSVVDVLEFLKGQAYLTDIIKDDETSAEEFTSLDESVDHHSSAEHHSALLESFYISEENSDQVTTYLTQEVCSDLQKCCDESNCDAHLEEFSAVDTRSSILNDSGNKAAVVVWSPRALDSSVFNPSICMQGVYPVSNRVKLFSTLCSNEVHDDHSPLYSTTTDVIVSTPFLPHSSTKNVDELICNQGKMRRRGQHDSTFSFLNDSGFQCSSQLSSGATETFESSPELAFSSTKASYDIQYSPKKKRQGLKRMPKVGITPNPGSSTSSDENADPNCMPLFKSSLNHVCSTPMLRHCTGNPFSCSNGTNETLLSPDLFM